MQVGALRGISIGCTKDIPEKHEQSRIVEQVRRRSDLNGRQAKVLSDVQSESIAVEILAKYGSIFTDLVMEPGGEKVKVWAANFDFVGEDMMPTMVKPAEEIYESRDIGSRPTTR